MNGRLRGKTAFVTGAASGIGRASALLFAAAADRDVEFRALGRQLAAAAAARENSPRAT